MGQQNGTAAGVADRLGRRHWSKQERRQIVEETLKPGASVSVVARAHDVNANQVFKWRKLYRAGRLHAETQTENRLLPVQISESLSVTQPTSVRRRIKNRRSGIIDIDLGHARVRIEGAADPECVRAALEAIVR